MLVQLQETEDLYQAVEPSSCARLVGDPSLFHFAYPIRAIINGVKKETSMVGKNRDDAEGRTRIDDLAYSADEFELDRGITRDAQAQVYIPLIAHAKGVGNGYFYDEDSYSTHKVEFNRGYQFWTEYSVSEFDHSVVLRLITNKPIEATEYVRVTAKLAYKVKDIFGDIVTKAMDIEHKFMGTDEYVEREKDVVNTTFIPPVKPKPVNHYCIHNSSAPCRNVGMYGTAYCREHCKSYCDQPAIPIVEEQTSTRTTFYAYEVTLTPNYEVDVVDRGLGAETLIDIALMNTEARPYTTAPVKVFKGDWLEVKMPDGKVNLYVCHTECSTNNLFGCSSYYVPMRFDLRHSIHYVLYFPRLRNKSNLKAADQLIEQALIDYCIYRWFFMVDPTEAERYYARFKERIESLREILGDASSCIVYRRPRLC